MSVTQSQAAALYAAVFNRAPDQAGLNYWIEQDSFNVMAASFVTHPVFTDKYGDLDDQAFVEAIYENVLLGQGDDEGVEFWVGALQGGLSRGEFLASFIDAALAYDGDDAAALLRKDALVNKVTVGLYYADTLGAASDFPEDTDLGSADIVDNPIYQKAVAAIADVTADLDTVEAAQAAIDREVEGAELINALNTYQTTAEATNQALVAEHKAAQAANEILDTELDEDSPDFVEQVTADLADEVELYAQDALLVSSLEGHESLELNDATIQLAREKFDIAINLAQAEVDLLKAQNKSAVNLQEKIQAYNGVAKQIQENHLDYNAESAKFGLANGIMGMIPQEEGLNNAADFAITLDFTLTDGDEGDQPVSVTLTVDKGKVVVESPDDNDAAVQAFNQFKGVDAYKAAVLALHGNIALQANAQKAIQTALLQALKDAGYQVYEKAEPTDKSVAWSKVAFDTNENGGVYLTNAALDDKTYELTSTINANQPIQTGDVLFSVGLIDEDGNIQYPVVGNDDFAVLGLDDNNAKTIADAAAASAEAVSDLSDLVEWRDAFEDALADYDDVLALQTALAEATATREDAVEAQNTAAEAFEGLGYYLVPMDEDGVATGELITAPDQDPNLFVYNTDLSKVENFVEDNLFYFGDKAHALIVLADTIDVTKGKLGGDNNVLEIFAQQQDGQTMLYVEKAAFAGGASTSAVDNTDLVKITLTGVQADELYFDNGFLQLA